MSNYALARSPNTPPETLERLANDEYWGGGSSWGC